VANCAQCGSAVTEGATFCPVCGAPQAVEGAPPEAAAPESPPAAGGDLGSMGYGAPPAGPQGGGFGGAPAPGGFGAAPPGGYGAPMPAARPAGSMPAYKFDARNLSTLDRVAAFATFILLIDLFLDWYHLSACSVLGISCTASATDHGYMDISVIACILILIVYAAKLGWGKLPFSLPVTDAQVVLGLSALNLLLVVIAFFDKHGLSWSYGAFLGLIAAIAALAPTIWPAVQKQMGARQ
jgi:hypothetical protein